MEEKKFGRGRKKGTVKKVSYIKDPILGIYSIEVSDHEFNVMEEGKDKPVAFCATLEGSLRNITKRAILNKEKTYTIKEYLGEYRELLTNIKQIINE